MIRSGRSLFAEVEAALVSGTNARLIREVTVGSHVDAVRAYFGSDHWMSFCDALQGDVWHAHQYIETSIHPDSLAAIIERYFAQRGEPLLRTIDYLTPDASSSLGALHNIHPSGLPHFDIFFRHSERKKLGPMDPAQAEDGKNSLFWGSAYMDRFYSGFEFRAIGDEEERKIRQYFKGRHWKDTIRKILDPDIIHLHCNLVISFDPKILELLIREELGRQGWTVDKIVPNVFLVNGVYTGKLVFLGRYPERVYDFGWKYNRDVLIETSMEHWNRTDVPLGFDLCFTSEFNNLIARNTYHRMSRDEIDSITF